MCVVVYLTLQAIMVACPSVLPAFSHHCQYENHLAVAPLLRVPMVCARPLVSSD